MEKYYTAERNVQIVVSLLKQYGIKRIIASPGTTNLTFVASVQHDPFFTVYSAPEERSAGYMAVGMAEESGEPVVITCTGATASRNYLPALTEAFYRKLPLIAITASQPKRLIGQLIPQVIDRSNCPADTVNFSTHIALVKDNGDAWDAELKMNQAMHSLKLNGGGPVHINLETSYDKDFSVRELPKAKKIPLYESCDVLPALPSGRIGVFIGAHPRMDARLTEAIDKFCQANNATVYCDHTSNYKGAFRLQYPLLLSQDNWVADIASLDIMIHIGGVSGAYTQPCATDVWRVNEDGMIRNPFNSLSAVFKMRELDFFTKYSSGNSGSDSFYEKCKADLESIRHEVPSDLPFSNIWIAQQLAPFIPENAVMHFGILNSLRSWNFFEVANSVNTYCNVGGFGIDGALSTVIGGALAQPERLHFIVLGDLAFFYDMNSLGNRHLPSNLRILLVNNGKGTEFTNYNHPAYAFGSGADEYMAAAGHYGHKSNWLVRHYAEDLGLEYRAVSDKAELIAAREWFVSPSMNKSLILEAFTDSEDENTALHIIRNLRVNGIVKLENSLRKVVGRRGVELAKKVLKR